MKTNKYTNKVSILTLLLASNALFSCTNRVHVLGARVQGEQINQSFQSNEYQAVEIDGPITNFKEKKEDEVKLARFEKIAEEYNDQVMFALLHKHLIDPSLLTEEKFQEIKETSKHRAISRKSEEILDLCIGIAKDKKYARELIKKEGLDLTLLPKDVLIEIKEEMDDPANAQYRTKRWPSRNVIIPGLCLVGGGIILYYKLFYSSSDNTNPASNRNSVRNTCDPLWACFKTNGRELITYGYNICKKGLTQKMIKDLNLHCYQQPHRLTREAYKAWRSTMAPPPAHSPYFSSNPFESNAG